MLTLTIAAVLAVALLLLAVAHRQLKLDHHTLKSQYRLWQEKLDAAQQPVVIRFDRYERIATIHRPGGDVQVGCDEFIQTFSADRPYIVVMGQHNISGEVELPKIRHVRPGDSFTWRYARAEVPPELTWLSLTPSLMPAEAADAAAG